MNADDTEPAEVCYFKKKTLCEMRKTIQIVNKHGIKYKIDGKYTIN